MADKIQLILQSLIFERMLAKQYSFYKDCCGIIVWKRQILDIKMTGMSSTHNNQAMGVVMPGNMPGVMIVQEQGKDTLTTGRLFVNDYIRYFFCCLCPSTAAIEIELNNERVSQAQVPFFCPCCGPYTVEAKNHAVLGQLEPHCYIMKCFCWHWFLPCCTELGITDPNMTERYRVIRKPCTCYCCTNWLINDRSGQQRGEVNQTGCFCPNFEVTLPEDSNEMKIMVLSAIALLP